MPRTLLTATPLTRAGVVVAATSVTAVNGAKVAFASNEPNLALQITNASGDAATLTFEIPTLVDGVAVLNGGKQATVADGTNQFFSCYTPTNYKQSDDMLYIDTDKTVTIRAFTVSLT